MKRRKEGRERRGDRAEARKKQGVVENSLSKGRVKEGKGGSGSK